MLTNALQKNPDAIGFAALDSKASAPLMDQAKSQNIPVIAFDSGVDSDVPRHHGRDRQQGRRGARPPSTWPS